MRIQIKQPTLMRIQIRNPSLMRGAPHLGVPLELLLQGVPSEVDNALRSLVGGLRQQHSLQHNPTIGHHKCYGTGTVI